MKKNVSEEAGLSKVSTNHCVGATAITLSLNARISIGHFVAISGHQSEQSRDLQLSSFDLLTPQMQPNLLRALPTSINIHSQKSEVSQQLMPFQTKQVTTK